MSSTGPPQNIFFVQSSEERHIRGCLQQELSLQVCRERFFGPRYINQIEQSGLNFTYDWPSICNRPSTPRNSSTASCVVRAHKMAFGAANLVGDPKKWGVLFSSKETPGYTWASLTDEFQCNVRDGWLESRAAGAARDLADQNYKSTDVTIKGVHEV